MTLENDGVQRATGEGGRLAVIAGALGCAVAATVMASTWRELARTWRDDAAFQWCWLVLPAALYSLSQRLRAERASPPRFDIRGLWATVPAASLWWLCDLMNLAVGQEIALVLALQGIAFSVLGARLYRACFASLALLFLMVPSADALQPLLRDVTLQGLDVFATIAGWPHRVDGYEIALGAQHYIVIDECSGLAPVTLSMFLGFFFATLLYRSIWKVLALAGAAALVGVASNLLRVGAIVWIDRLRGSQMALSAHAGIQWLSVGAVLGLLLFALGRLRGDRPVPSAEVTGRQGARRGDRFAPVVVALAIPLTVWALAATGRALGGASAGARSTASATMQPLPATLAGAARVDVDQQWTPDADRATASAAVTYRRGSLELRATVVETLSPMAKLPRWQLPASPSGRWHDMQATRAAPCDARGCIAYSRVILQGGQLEDRRTMAAAYCDADLMTDSVLQMRLAHAWKRLRGSGDLQRSVVLVANEAGLGDGELAEALRALCVR